MTRGWWQTRRFAIVAMVLATIPLWWPAVPPLVDLPGHMGRYRVQIDGGAHPWLSQWYGFHWLLVGNLGVDLLVQALAPLVGLEAAVKLIVAAIPALTVGGMLWIAREAHGRVPATALFALPLAYAQPFHYGFVNFSLAIALALPLFAWWLRLGRQGRRRLRIAVFVPAACLLWLAHVFGWGLLGLLAFGAEHAAARTHSRKIGPGSWIAAVLPAVQACLPLLPPAVLMVAWRSGDGVAGVTTDWFNLVAKLAWVTMVVRDRWFVVDVATAAALIAALYRGLRRADGGGSPQLLTGAALLTAAFLLLPGWVFGSAFADMRLAPFAVAIALLAVRPTGGDGRLALAAGAVIAVRLAATTASFWLFDQENQRELAALGRVPIGARLVSFVSSDCPGGWTLERREHLPGLALERRLAFSNDQWALPGAQLLTVCYPAPGFRHSPSQVVPSGPCPTKPTWRSLDDSLRLLPRDAFDHVWLIRPPPFDPRLVRGMTPLWRAGTSVLYRIDHRPRPLPDRAGRP